jgi:hypothetical protein
MQCLRCGENIETGLTATETGTYKLRGLFNGGFFVLNSDFTVGEDIYYPSTGLNEYYAYNKVSVISPSGDILKSDLNFKILPTYE